MLGFIFKQSFSILLLVMLILLFFKMNNKLLFNSTLVMLVAYIPLRRFFNFMNYDEQVNNLLSNYPILETVDYYLPFLLVIMTIVVLMKYKKQPNSIYKKK